MDRTIPPGIPAGEDAGAVVGVEDPDNTEHNRSKVSSKARLGRSPEDRIKDRAARSARIGGRMTGPAAVQEGRIDPIGPNSAVRAR